jgi:hypothetical protein
MATVDIDDSGLRAFEVDLREAGSGISAKVTPVVHRGAGNVQRQLNAEMRASTHFKGVLKDGRIDYDLTRTATEAGGGIIEAEIGPRSGPGRSGALANIAYFGGSRGGGTVPDPAGALEAEAPRFEKALADVLEQVLR